MCLGGARAASAKRFVVHFCVNLSAIISRLSAKQVANFHSFILPRVYKDDSNSEQTVRQDSTATQDALITARIN